MSDEWVKEAPLTVTVCDENGTIVEMNDQSALSFADSGGRKLIGSHVLDCHPEPSRSKLRSWMAERGHRYHCGQAIVAPMPHRQ